MRSDFLPKHEVLRNGLKFSHNILWPARYCRYFHNTTGCFIPSRSCRYSVFYPKFLVASQDYEKKHFWRLGHPSIQIPRTVFRGRPKGTKTSSQKLLDISPRNLLSTSRLNTREWFLKRNDQYCGHGDLVWSDGEWVKRVEMDSEPDSGLFCGQGLSTFTMRDRTLRSGGLGLTLSRRRSVYC